MVLDALGGDDWKKGYGLLRPAGMLVTYGFANMAPGPRRSLLHVARQFLSVPRFSPLALMEDNRAVAGVNMGHLWGEPEMLLGEFAALLTLFEEGRIRPRIDSAFSFEEAAQAHQRLQGRGSVGKVLLIP
jgi:NADPH:quinone reductase-like Zn-dependent oxidoreductase